MQDGTQAAPSGTPIPGKYDGDGPDLFKLALGTGVLTVLTLGIYRFWARTRIRRYMWSATTPDGTPFEYTGKGLEKFLGFLIAVVILAVYLGVIQLLLTFAGFSLVGGTATEIQVAVATNVTILAVIPLIFIAQYRGRRYLLSRTRWRGIRFGVEKGAFGYMWRAMVYYFLAIITLGILLPLATFKLEQYRVDRTWFGDAPMTQGGRWTMLYPAMKHLAFGIGFFILAGVVAAVLEMPEVAPLLGIIGYVWFFVGFISYRVQSFAILARHKLLADDIGFTAEPKTKTVIYHMIVGGLIVGLIFSAIIGIAVGIGFALFSSAGGFSPEPGFPFSPDAIGWLFVIPVLLYVFALIALDALTLVFIQQPILSHYVETLVLQNGEALARVKQREGDDFADADGFADALDVGAGI